jgi:hypothetical protein
VDNTEGFPENVEINVDNPVKSVDNIVDNVDIGKERVDEQVENPTQKSQKNVDNVERDRKTKKS